MVQLKKCGFQMVQLVTSKESMIVALFLVAFPILLTGIVYTILLLCWQWLYTLPPEQQDI